MVYDNNGLPEIAILASKKRYILFPGVGHCLNCFDTLNKLVVIKTLMTLTFDMTGPATSYVCNVDPLYQILTFCDFLFLISTEGKDPVVPVIAPLFKRLASLAYYPLGLNLTPANRSIQRSEFCSIRLDSGNRSCNLSLAFHV